MPWLLVNLITTFIAAFSVSIFEYVIVQITALAVIMPIIVGMGGNSGAQTLSIVVRSIALGEINIEKDWKYIFNEFSIGLLNGLITGIFAGLVIYFRYTNFFLCIFMVTAIIINLIIGNVFGFIIPLVLKKLKFLKRPQQISLLWPFIIVFYTESSLMCKAKFYNACKCWSFFVASPV